MNESKDRMFRRAPVFAARAVCMAAAVTMGLAGCVGYNTVTTTTELDERGFKDPNSPPLPTLMREAARWVTNRYPPQDDPNAIRTQFGTVGGGARTQEFAVSLVNGLRPPVYRTIVAGIGELARPMSPETEHLPTYYISRVVVNGDHARVDVLRPLYHISPGSGGQLVYQGITVDLRGGFQPWRVTNHREWGIGSLPVPERVYIGQDPLPPIGTEGRRAPNPPAPTMRETPGIEPGAENGGAPPAEQGT